MPRGEVRVLSVAPMMQRTDRHFRVFLRGLTTRTLLYTEMVTTGAILHGDRGRHLEFSELERPLALQLGGDDPTALAECARIAQGTGYDEVNLNVGCPSDRVQSGRFGASLMARPDDVARAVEAMRNAVTLPVTVKHRIGIDDLDRYEDMLNFVDVVAAAGADRFSIHARKAWLQGLSPKQNRTVPPLRYDDVYRLKAERPTLVVELNGGVTSLDEVTSHLPRVDAVMVGRAAYDAPFMLADADERIFGEAPRPVDRFAAIEAILPYVERLVAGGGRLHWVTRHLVNLFAGRRGTGVWKRHLGGRATLPGAGAEVLTTALEAVRAVQAT